MWYSLFWSETWKFGFWFWLEGSINPLNLKIWVLNFWPRDLEWRHNLIDRRRKNCWTIPLISILALAIIYLIPHSSCFNCIASTTTQGKYNVGDYQQQVISGIQHFVPWHWFAYQNLSFISRLYFKLFWKFICCGIHIPSDWLTSGIFSPMTDCFRFVSAF